MHRRNNCHRHLWLLSGTGEGPSIAKSFLSKGWKVSVSLVSSQAAFPYLGINLENLWIGSLSGIQEIQEILKQGPSSNSQFDLVLDATHPFAMEITSNLYQACSTLNQRIIRFDRRIDSPRWANYISKVEELSLEDLNQKRFLFAIGARNLRKGVKSVQKAGAIAFARILPTPESLREALASNLRNENLALLRPSRRKSLGAFEEALCKKWSITSVVCRQSGGLIQDMWQTICLKNKLDLWMISRPKNINGLKIIRNIDEILEKYVDG